MDPTAAPNPTPPNSRRFPIRLQRPLSIGLATAALVVAAVGLHVGVPMYQEHVALCEIERLRGQMIRRDSGPAWLRRWLHDEYRYLYDLPNSVSFQGTAVTDNDLVILRRLPSLQGLLLRDTQVTDAGLVHLKRMTHLKFINLERTQVTDAGIADLKTSLPALTVKR
jgi:hypothetical protein